jgi:predicted nucleotidyltransferase
MDTSNLRNPTPYQDINEVLQALVQGFVDVFADNLVGVYLFGSLSYGDFNPESSDIDLMVIVHRPVSQYELALIEQLQRQVGTKYEKWADRIEISYTPREMLQNVLPPEQPRPYFGEGVFYPEAHYGNEWIINLYLLYQHGITLLGPEFKTLVDPIAIVEVQKACIRDLFKEWEPKLTDPDWLNNSHYQSYLVLNLCRILYTVMRGSTGSKKVSAQWVKGEYGEWHELIETAENWHYGIEMNRQEDTLAFLRFVIEQVKGTELYTQLQ